MTIRIVCRMTAGFGRVEAACAGLPGVELIQAASAGEAADALHRGATGLITYAGLYTRAVADAVADARPAWLHMVTSGVDPLEAYPPPPGVQLSTGGRVWAPAVAEHALALALGLTRQLHLAERSRAACRWSRAELLPVLGVLRKRHALIVGFGAVGTRIARLLEAFGVRVRAVASRGRNQGGVAVHPPAALADLLPRVDLVIVAMPLRPATRGLIGRAELGIMRPGALLVDVSRGGVVDGAALCEALDRGPLAGAALDVFEREPLPPGDPLWRLPNVILTPHAAGFGDDEALEEMAEICRHNLEDLMAGRKLRDGFTP